MPHPPGGPGCHPHLVRRVLHLAFMATLAACGGAAGPAPGPPDPPPVVASCTGTAPAHALPCPGASGAPAADTPRYVTAACAGQPCSYGCAAGFAAQGGTCVAGTPPPLEAARLADGGDGTLVDEVTGLRWLRRPACEAALGGLARPGGLAGFDESAAWVAHLGDGACGLSDGSAPGDWLLPSYEQLRRIPGAAGADLFQGAAVGPAWTRDEPCATTALTVDPVTGEPGEHPKEEPLGAWPYRVP